MEASIEDRLYQAILANEQNTISELLEKGANPNRIITQGKTCLGEAAGIGNVDILKALITATRDPAANKASPSDTANTISPNNTQQRQSKCQKRKLNHEEQEETLAKCKNLKDRSVTDFKFGKLDNIGKADKNQGYYVYVHEGSSQDESRVGPAVKDMKPPPTPAPLTPDDDLEWDEDIVEVAPTTSEDEKWTSMYRWYASILESTGAAIASASMVKYGVNNQDAFTRTALHYAAEQGHVEAVKLLLAEDGVQIDVIAGDGATPLHLAAVKNHIETVKVLLNAGAHVNYKTHEKMTALHFAASRGYVDMAKLLVQSGAYLETRDTSERTPLYLAASRGHADIIKYLVSAGANVNGEGIQGYTPLCEAVWQSYTSVAEVLLSSGARITPSHRLLHHAIIQKSPRIVELLASYGAAINQHNDIGDTPLLLAIRLSRPELAKILLNKGANINARNSVNGSNILHVIVESIEDPDKLKDLILYAVDHKVNMDTTALTGDTALNRAMMINKDPAAVLLIRHGADVNACELSSFCLDNMSIATKKRTPNMASMLLKSGYSVSIPDPNAIPPREGTTAHWLYYACRNPLSLADLCRIKIRYLGKNTVLHRFIDSLPLPKSLKEFLMMEEEGE